MKRIRLHHCSANPAIADCGIKLQPLEGVYTWNEVDCRNCLKNRYDAEWFWEQVDKTGDCWIWKGVIEPSEGYGVRTIKRRRYLAHRLAYEFANGPIPNDLQIDHSCHNADLVCKGGRTCLHRRCVNPAHLELASINKNVLSGKGNAATNARKTHCIHGHPLSGDNLRQQLGKSPRRACRKCARDWVKADYHKRAAALTEAGEETETPLDMLLFCPRCGAQHIDAPDERTPDWTNPPHKTHLCHECKHLFRPSDKPTNGVATIKSKRLAETGYFKEVTEAGEGKK